MKYSHIQLNADNTFHRYIDSNQLIAWDENNYCTAFALEKDNKSEQFLVHSFYPIPQPNFNPMTQNVVEIDPALIGDKWTQQWHIQDLPLEEIAEKFAAKELEAIVASKKNKR